MKTGLAVLIFLLIVSPVCAAKKLVRTAKTTSVSFSKVALSRPTHNAVISFFNLARVKRIEYTLSYTANGISQGVMGSFAPTGQSSDNRNLYFGTCSKGVCTPHINIEKASLTITTTLVTGNVNTKRYIFKKV